MSRTFVIGDIHGCKDMLMGLLHVIRYEPGTDHLIFVGDYVDRGPDPKGVVDLILELKEGAPGRVDCILGNHEALLLDVISGFGLELYLYNGGGATLRSYGTTPRFQDLSWLPEAHRGFYEGLTPYLDLEDYLIVHAGLVPGKALNEQALEDLLWIREPFIFSNHDFGKRVIFGHTPFREPLVMKNKIGIDTGAVYGNKLTALELEELRFYSYP
jgi:serine/threonine protein phosphatase 1